MELVLQFLSVDWEKVVNEIHISQILMKGSVATRMCYQRY